MRWRRLAPHLLAALLVLALAAAGGGLWLLSSSLPQTEGELVAAGLEAPVRILRDRHAVPLIEAESEHDAWAALGFVHAQDRLWQMEMQRRTGQGRLAEILGPEALPVDRFMRTLGLRDAAEAGVAHLSPDGRRLLEAYAAGVNAFLDQGGRLLPPEFLLLRHRPEPWRVADSLVFARLMALQLAGNWRQELVRAALVRRLPADLLADLWPDRPPEGPVTLSGSLPPEERLVELAMLGDGASSAGLGSNIFALAGSRTASGAPLLASDPHLPLRSPGLWYLARLEAPGLAVMGGTMPGLPAVIIGRNRDVAWGFTTTNADTEDLFLERPDPADPLRYLAPGGALAFETREELIAVRGEAPVRHVVRATRHGPVISDLPGLEAPEADLLALAWTALDPTDTTVEAGFAMARARSGEELQRALRLFRSPVQNAAWADRQKIGFAVAGAIPVRRGGDGRLPVPGWTGEADWLGTLAPEVLPQASGPASGLFINANNKVVDRDYPHLITADWDSPLRARRLERLLAGRRGIGREEAAAAQLDLHSPLAAALLPLLRAVAPAGAAEDELLAALRAWDGHMAPEAPEPLVFAAWQEAFARAMAEDELGDALFELRPRRDDFLQRVVAGRQAWCDDVRTAAVENCDELAAAALRRVLPALRERYGEDWRAWRWADAHRAVMAHQPFAQAPMLERIFGIEVPDGGDSSTLDVAHYRAQGPAGPFPTVHAAGLRMIADLAGDSALFITATGQSGHPLSPHHDDLARLWGQGSYIRLGLRETVPTGPVLRLRPPSSAAR
ncbi:penicillin acylase family protein [Geminicoccaceae bacterium 1502E]|nr:penicillin acylase family protein [Geminicoccaceae bacterium 1502E]